MIDLPELPGQDEDRERAWTSSPAYRERLRRMARECREHDCDEDERAMLGRMQNDEDAEEYSGTPRELATQ